jgi:hypothetical protein
MAKLIGVKDNVGSTLWVNPDHLICVMVPGPLVPGDGLCVVLTVGGGTMNKIPRENAERLIAMVNTSDAVALPQPMMVQK